MELKDTTIISVTGRIDRLSCGKLNEFLQKQVNRGNVNLLLDFKNVDFTDVVGLRVLISSVKQTRSKGGDLFLVNVSSVIKNILITTGFSNLLTIFTDMDSALMSFQTSNKNEL